MSRSRSAQSHAACFASKHKGGVRRTCNVGRQPAGFDQLCRRLARLRCSRARGALVWGILAEFGAAFFMRGWEYVGQRKGQSAGKKEEKENKRHAQGPPPATSHATHSLHRSTASPQSADLRVFMIFSLRRIKGTRDRGCVSAADSGASRGWQGDREPAAHQGRAPSQSSSWYPSISRSPRRVQCAP